MMVYCNLVILELFSRTQSISSHISIIYRIQNAFEFRFPGTPEGIYYMSFPKLIMPFYLHKNMISSQLQSEAIEDDCGCLKIFLSE